MKCAVVASAVLVSLLAGCYGRSDAEVQGYVEGDFVRVSLPASGIVETVTVSRGSHVKKGEVLFTLDSNREKAALDKARFELEAARAEVSNLLSAVRNDEIEALQSGIAELKAQLAYTAASYRRKLTLSRSGAASMDEVERLRSEESATRAKIRASESRLHLAQLSIGREGEIEAAQKMLQFRQAAVREAEANLALRHAVAPDDALVSNIIYRPGETVTNGQAVLELLPPQNVKARFFLSPKQVGWVTANPEILLRCENCGEGIAAKVVYVAPEASYRPPILYSRNQSEKLVFMAEAVPHASTELLHPGLPLTVVFSK
ncbi:HlyD family efflux transporter periplasmic adaptor subunit [uncultured Desulfovibrio sp.]|uniref:HlyD family secretion protein n=1 Tax=uncultured Desulfovibrio sp. TaxID=167968 RepID=UPI00039CE673|nr:HlyD family efflux transporter periplasmic adaptor subunit [uncultured Desulfovibrio sp.]